jgi:deoxyadenosine/deoxycytidine kinase
MVEGNIGAGKSTFLKLLSEKLEIEAIFEPTNKWQNKNDEENLLHLFYKDTPRWAYTFQSFAFISRVNEMLKHQKEAPNKKIHVLERSVYCDRYCFAKNCFESGLMTNLEWQIYKEWFSWLAETHAPQPSGFIYLKTTPQTCLNRMKKRSRNEEVGISINYLEKLHNRHEEWLILKKGISPYISKIPVLALNCDEEFETDIKKQEEHIKSVQEFIYQVTTLPSQIPPRPTVQSQL